MAVGGSRKVRIGLVCLHSCWENHALAKRGIIPRLNNLSTLMPQSVQERREERIGKIGDRLTDKTEPRLCGEGCHQGKSDIDIICGIHSFVKV